MSRGLFISIEGGDRVGKDTALEVLLYKLNELDLFCTREPGGNGSVLAESIRKLVKDPFYSEMLGRTEAFLYAASRYQHIHEVIIPRLKTGQTVITNRYAESSFCYQVLREDNTVESIVNINKEALGLNVEEYCWYGKKYMVPDYTIILTLPEEERIRRFNNHRGKKDRLEMADDGFFKQVANNYFNLASNKDFDFYINDSNIIYVDASGTPSEVASALLNALGGIIESNKDVFINHLTNKSNLKKIYTEDRPADIKDIYIKDDELILSYKDNSTNL